MEALLLHHGYWMLFVASWLEGQISTLVSGFLIWTGYFNPWIALGIIVLADIINDSLYYRIGRRLFKLPRIARFFDKSKFLSYNLDMVKKFWFDYPIKTALLGKNAYIISVAIIAGAGVSKMPYLRFLTYTIPASLVQPILLLFIGYSLGNGYNLASQYIQYPGIIIAVFIVGFVSFYYNLRKYISKTFKK